MWEPQGPRQSTERGLESRGGGQVCGKQTPWPQKGEHRAPTRLQTQHADAQRGQLKTLGGAGQNQAGRHPSFLELICTGSW